MAKSMQKIFLLLAISLISAVSGWASKYVLHHLSMESLMLLRFWIAALCVLPFIVRIFQKINWKSMILLIGASSGMWLSSIFYVSGIRTTNLGVAQAIFLLVPVLTLLLSYWILEEKIKTYKIIGIMISIVGASIIFFLPRIYEGVGLNVGDIRGNIFILISALAYVSYLIFMKRTTFSHIEFMHWGLIWAAILWTILGSVDILQWGNPYKNITLIDLSLILFIWSIGTVYMYFLVQKLMKISSAFFTSFWVYIQLIFSTLLWYFFFDEYIGIGFLVWSILTIYGVYSISKTK